MGATGITQASNYIYTNCHLEKRHGPNNRTKPDNIYFSSNKLLPIYEVMCIKQQQGTKIIKISTTDGL